VQLCPAADEQRSDPLRGADLVTRDGEKIERLRCRIDLHLAECLDAVSMKDRALGLCIHRKIRYRLDRADLVVDPHH
jgi:hypothetical protein